MYGIFNRLASICRRSIVTKSSDNTNNVLYCQVQHYGRNVEAETIYPYGYLACPPIKTPTITFSINGSEANLAAIPYARGKTTKRIYNGSQLGTQPGEVVVGDELTGSYIAFAANGDVIINAANNIIVNGKQLNLTSSGDTILEAQNCTLKAKVHLGEGGAAIARVGDAIDTQQNKIVGGSSNNTSA